MGRKIRWETLSLDNQEVLHKLKYDDREGYVATSEMKEIVHLVNTPNGIASILDPFNLFTFYNTFYRGNTNFRVTHKIAHVIEHTNGIDYLRILSPYSFIIAIGKIFQFSDISIVLHKRLCRKSNGKTKVGKTGPDKVLNRVDKLKEQLSSTNKKWAIYVFPSGQHVYSTEGEQNFEESLQIYRKTKDVCGGYLLSWEDKPVEKLSV